MMKVGVVAHDVDVSVAPQGPTQAVEVLQEQLRIATLPWVCVPVCGGQFSTEANPGFPIQRLR